METYLRKGAARTLADGALAVLMALITPLLEKNAEKALATPGNADHRAASAKTLQEKLDAKLDVTLYQRDRTADSAWKSETHEILLDALCARLVDPRNHRCRQR